LLPDWAGPRTYLCPAVPVVPDVDWALTVIVAVGLAHKSNEKLHEKTWFLYFQKLCKVL
jgi:hypothetical protein